MKITDLPQPYRALAELRAKQFPNRYANLTGNFTWQDSPEGHDFWRSVWNRSTPLPIPQSSLDELAWLNLWPVAERLPYDEKPLPKGFDNPPEGWLFIGMDGELPRSDFARLFYGYKGDDWEGPSNYLSKERQLCTGGIAAPAHLVRRLSTQRRAERRAKHIKPSPPAEDRTWRVIADTNITDMTDPMTLDEAMEMASKLAATMTYSSVYVAKVHCRFRAESVVKKEVF